MVQGAALRFPPQRLWTWAGLRPCSDGVEECVLVPGQATWEGAETMDARFALRVAMLGLLGFSGDLAGLPEAMRAALAEQVALYKTWRERLDSARYHLLTPACPRTDRTGWAGIQLELGDGRHVVFAYRLRDAAAAKSLVLRALDPARRYRLMDLDDGVAHEVEGARLTTDGWRFQADRPCAARLLAVEALPG
jgi:hypothetical protein